jgi:hypothetical protein
VVGVALQKRLGNVGRRDAEGFRNVFGAQRLLFERGCARQRMCE